MQAGHAITDADRDLLRSILKQDNERIQNEIADATAEIVFELAFEGGGIEVTQFTTAEGKVYFRNSGASMRLDDNDDEEWVDWQSDPTTSFEGALRDLKMGRDILCISPIRLHRDYSELVCRHIEAVLADVTSDDRERMGTSLPESVEAWFSRIRH